MDELFDQFGLPKELQIQDAITKEAQTIEVESIKKKFGKKYTIIKGMEHVDLKTVAKKLKSKFACGGTVKDGAIELQGDHLASIKDVLANLGFPPATVTIKK